MVWPTLQDNKLSEYDAMELPGQQLPAALAATPLDHLLNLDIQAPSACQRLTGIMVTVGKKDIALLEEMIGAGMNIAILNFNFGTKEDHIEMIKNLRYAAKNYSEQMGKNYPLAIAGWLYGRKIRTGTISDTYGTAVELKYGDQVRITDDETYRERCSSSTIFVDFVDFANHVKKNDYIIIDNEAIALKVEIISANTLTCVVERGGILGSRKDVFIPNHVFEMPNYDERDKVYIQLAVHYKLDILIAPFVNNKYGVLELRNLLGEEGSNINIIAKIQTSQGIKNFDEIVEVANGIMISRQELGSDITPKKLVVAQKNMIARANKVNMPISVSAQLLSSMRNNKRALRAELLDVSNCILDGADALVLNAETAVGNYPVETITCLAITCKEAEACIWSKQIFYDLIDKTPIPCDQATVVSMTAVLAAQRTLAAAIVVVTYKGKSATTVAKYRPRCPIFAVTRHAIVARQLHLWRGVIPIIYEDKPQPNWQDDTTCRVNYCIKWGMDMGFVRVGDPIIILSGWRQGSGYTNTMRIVYASTDT